MRYIAMTATEDQEFGGLGLAFNDSHKMCNGMFTAQNGLLVAHDIIEHQQGVKSIGSIGDEMIALGAVCHTRAQHGEMSRDGSGSMYSPEQSVASDILRMGELFLTQGVPMRQKLTRSHKQPLGHMVENVIDCAREGIRKEREYWREPERVTQERIDDYLAQCQTLMNHGVTLARRRFGDGYLANNMFWQIEEAVQGLFKYELYEGAQYRLCYDAKSAYAEETYPEEY